MIKLTTKFKPIPSALETAVQAGFQFAEIWLDAALLSRWREIAALAQEYPLSYGLHFPNHGPIDDDTLVQAVELYRALDCRAMVIHQPMIADFGESLTRLHPPMRLAVENHRLSPEQFDLWAEENRWLTLDIEHVWKFTLADAPLPRLLESLRGFLHRHGDKLAHVHLPGYLPGNKEHRPMYCSPEMVWSSLTLLAEFGYDGLVVSEVNSQFQNLDDLQRDRLLVDQWRVEANPMRELPS